MAFSKAKNDFEKHEVVYGYVVLVNDTHAWISCFDTWFLKQYFTGQEAAYTDTTHERAATPARHKRALPATFNAFCEAQIKGFKLGLEAKESIRTTLVLFYNDFLNRAKQAALANNITETNPWVHAPLGEMFARHTTTEAARRHQLNHLLFHPKHGLFLRRDVMAYDQRPQTELAIADKHMSEVFTDTFQTVEIQEKYWNMFVVNGLRRATKYKEAQWAINEKASSKNKKQ